jgi:hypothetical protein
VNISAVLRIGIHYGIEVVHDRSPLPLLDTINVKAGIEVAVLAHLAEFVTNVTHAPNDKDCNLKVIQEHNLALGAVAGVSLEVGLPNMPPQT